MKRTAQRFDYMKYWCFTAEEKEAFIRDLTDELPALRAAAEVTQEELANAIGVSRQTYNAMEGMKRSMTWNSFMSLILFFDYHPATHITARRLFSFPPDVKGKRLKNG